MKDYDFLCWIHARLEHTHGESPLVDYMHKLRAIIRDMPKNQISTNANTYNSLEELRKNL